LNEVEKIHLQNEEECISGNKKFLAIIGHDIKTPMGSIIGFLSLLKEGVFRWDRSKIDENIDIALFSARRTLIMLDNLLEWALSERMSKSFKPEIVDFSELLNEEIKNTVLSALQKQINIKNSVGSYYNVIVNRNMVKSIIRNLLNNAIKYSYKNGSIDISAKKINGFLEIIVKDYGIGINSDVLDTIFNSDGYTSTLGTQNESGTGFGLLVCKDFVNSHKGKIWIISEPGEGSEFHFTLPLSP